MDTEKFKVIIVEDVKLELKGTEEIFRHEIPNAEVIGTAMTEADFWALLVPWELLRSVDLLCIWHIMHIGEQNAEFSAAAAESAAEGAINHAGLERSEGMLSAMQQVRSL